MANSKDAINTRQGALWVQPDGPNTPVYFLGCHDLGDISEAEGDIELIRCMDKRGGWKTVGKLQSPPDPVSTSIEWMTFVARDWLEKLGCEFTLYATQRIGAEPDIFYNHVRAKILNRCTVTTRTDKQIVHHEEEQASSQSLDIEAWPPVYRTGKLTAKRLVTSETQDLVDVNAYSAMDCEAGIKPGDQVLATTAPSLYSGNVIQTLDAGANWASLAVDPFAAGKAGQSVVAFPLSDTVTRILVAQLAVGGQQGKVAYSDDNGATWTTVNIGGAAAGHGATGPGALFALNQGNVWLASAEGYIYYSSDGGASWTAQTSGGLTTENVNSVFFVDENFGMAGADNDELLYTSDGGSTWELVTATGDTGNILSISNNYGNFWWATTDSGTIYYSRNNGTTWTQRRFSGDGAQTVPDMAWANELVGYMIHNQTIFVTINGGFTWNAVETPVNSGLNALSIADLNTVYAVGDVNSGTAVIIKTAWE